VRAAYLRRAAEHPRRIRVIDAARTIAEIQLELEEVIVNI
jgi:thymidylate kinase